MASHLPLYILVAVAFLVGLYLISFAIATMSGWRQLASGYANDLPLESVEWRRVQAHLRRRTPLNSNLQLSLGGDRQYLYLKTWPFNFPGFRELRVPWEDILFHEGTVLMWKRCALQFRARPDISIHLSEHAMESVVTRAGGQWANGQPQFPV